MQRKRRINGEREITLSFLSSTINDPFIYDIDMRWHIEFDGETYVVIDPGKETDDGNNIVVTVKGIKKFFVDNNAVRLFDEAEQKSMTATQYFLDLYQGSDKWVNLIDNFYANRVTLTKGHTRQERHNKGLEYFDMEQVVSKDSTRVDLYNMIGRELDKVFHEDLNMRGFKWDLSSSGFHTYARGFGKQEEDGTYVATADYKSPLADIYGIIEGPHIEDDRFTDSASIRAALKKQVDNSYEVSTSFEVEDLRHHGYTIHEINEGDHIWTVSKKLKIKLQLRIIEIQETFDVEGKLIGASYTVGNKAITQSYKDSQRSMLYEFTASLKGNRKLSKSVLPGATMFYTNLLNEARSYFQYLPTGVIGIDQNDPLQMIKIVHNGMGISNDGGKTYTTAVTGAGIVATTITTGVLNTNLVKIQGTEGHFFIDGDMLKATSYNDSEKFVELTAEDGLHISGGQMRVDRDDGGAASVIAGRNTLGERLQGMNPAFMSPAVDVFGQRYRNDTDEMHTVDAYYYDQYFRDIQINFAFRNNSETESITIEYGVSGFGSDIDMRETDTVTVPPQTTEYPQLDFHVSVPQKNQRQFYIQFRRITTSNSALMSIARVKNLDMNKYNHL